VQAVSDHVGLPSTLQQEIMEILVAMMRDSSPLAFAEEHAENFEIVRDMLDKHVALEASPDRKVQGLTAVLGLAIQRGALGVLPALHTFVRAVTAPAGPGSPGVWAPLGKPATLLAASLTFLQQLASFRIQESFALFAPGARVGDSVLTLASRVRQAAAAVAVVVGAAGTTVSARNTSGGEEGSETEEAALLRAAPAYCALAPAPTSGFLYVHTASGVFKVGSGVGGSLRGFNYAHTPYASGRTASLFHFQDKLFVSQAPKFLVTKPPVVGEAPGAC
jgi:hypothetical protein